MNSLNPINPIARLKYKFLEWKWDRVLEKSGHSSWESYLRYNDPGYNPRGRSINDQFCGYPYVACVPCKYLTKYKDSGINGLDQVYDWGGYDVEQWCKENCKHRFRCELERVIKDHQGQYLQNGIAGIDEFFVGFKDYDDFITFKTVWS
jgi:hypothetical protein